MNARIGQIDQCYQGSETLDVISTINVHHFIIIIISSQLNYKLDVLSCCIMFIVWLTVLRWSLC